MSKISLQKQAYQRMESMLRIGESKKAAKAAGTARDGIYSWSTYHTLRTIARWFLSYVVANHPECTSLRHTKKYISEYLEWQQSRGLHVTTLVNRRNYINKLLAISPGDHYYCPLPPRRRADYTRSRLPVGMDSRFSVSKNANLISFCRATGLRRFELEKLRAGDLYSATDIASAIAELSTVPQKTTVELNELRALHDAQLFEEFEYFLRIRGKGGRVRYCPIIGDNRDSIITFIQSTPKDEKLFPHVACHADIHSYRAEYAASLYLNYARPICEIPYVHSDNGAIYQPDVYIMRHERAGEMFDRSAMLMASKALGHNRVNVIAESYLYGIEGERKNKKNSVKEDEN